MHNLIGGRIRHIRKTLKMTQEALAAQLGVSQQHISHVENGTKQASQLLIKHICLLFDTTETWLTTGKGDVFLSNEEIIKNQILHIGERAFAEALRKLLNDDSLEVLGTLLGPRLGEKPYDPSLEPMIDFLVDLWSLRDEKLKSWALVQFERAFPEDMKEKVKNSCANNHNRESIA
ncbi:helix-turn-helix domain-containing protein [Syntrophomonas wolfei]|uniref:helix-turn-helix domain-containing protein n=1 Tax=Syntrophomonas wolfei TaxID=863 RepID=UPI0009EB66CC|nr:helix-turn-helix transcriptional regulator [Syntrophomonas wolfei]